MPRRPVVVDGSNLATEGRSMPSLAQLDEAVRAWLAENPDDEVIVVVDASFGYRIPESEQKMFEEAEEAGELVSPPAGAVGRGDGFLLRIADRVDAAVLSNDSFQEFHGDYPWLFDSGRLLGGKPVPGVGWIFTPRTPVRGPKSRMAVRDAKRAKKSPRSEPVVEAIAEATAEALEPSQASGGRRGRRRGRAPSRHEAVNEPLPFITFIAEHPLGTEVEGEVESFTSHGAFVLADGARCYVPVSGLGDPPPRTAKAALKRGETRRFVVQALDPPRRGIELALPGLARVAGAPTDETVEAEIAGARTASSPPDGEVPRRRRRGRRGTPVDDGQAQAPEPAPPEPGPTEPAMEGSVAERSPESAVEEAP
ncbi:MAG TPA: S1 RNA-binding domain-containing protein, partial [Acidimicrobiales bacterium]|nr:S1 RNA-binding domain-containing protein [Acidimicrobiales bacterium]